MISLVSSVTPSLKTGDGVRSYGVIAALARREPVNVSYIVFNEARPGPEYDALPAVSMRPMHASRGARRAIEYLRARRRDVPGHIARGVSPQLLRAAVAEPGDVRIVADGPVVAAALLPVARRREAIYLAHNLESGFRTEWGRGDLRAFERDVLRTFAECWMPTRAEVAAAVELGGEKVNARYVPNVVDVGKIKPLIPSGQHRILFVGDFTYGPNREGLSFLADRVMPLVWERHSDVSVSVAGRGLDQAPPDGRIEALGFVPDLSAVYATADVVVVPLLHGGGSPLKFTEALAYGLPVVATDHASRLLEDGAAGVHFMSAASANAFADAVVRMLEDRDQALAIGAAGRELAARCYSIDTLAAIFES